LLRLSAGGAALAVGSATLLERVDAQTTLRVRRNVGAMAPDDPALEAYRQAVAAMKNLPSTDRRSWSYRANIHNNHCPHGNWYFLPWHRAYLLELEVICRSLLPSTSPLKTTFVMPYWNWPQHRTLASLGGGAFTQASWNGQPNPLLNTTRAINPTASLPDEFVGQSVIDNILAQTQFEVFASSRPSRQNSTNSTWQRRTGRQGPLEATPHNSVHNWIGGDMRTFFSPFDPLFWLHHANCDRLWAEWNRRGNANASDSLWRNFVFRQNFVRPDGTLYDVTVRDLTDILALGYHYDNGGPQPATATAAVSSSGPTEAAAAELSPIATFSARNAQSASPLRPLSVNVPAGGAPFASASQVILGLLDVTLVAGSTADGLVRVFLDGPGIGPQAPPAGPFYVGTFSFFGSHALHGPSSFTLSATRAVRGLLASRHVFGDTLSVQLVPVLTKGGAAQRFEVTPAVVEVTLYE
jgi:tyrosinase